MESQELTNHSPKPTSARIDVPVSAVTQEIVEKAYRSYESRLFHAALRITRNEDDARDAVQEGLVSALRNAEHFRGDAAVASWLYSIVVNAALYQRRRFKARQRGVDIYTRKVWPEAELSFDAGSRVRDPETYAIARIELGRAVEDIEALPSDKRALLEQALGGDTCGEIARRAGQPVAAIKSKLWRTRVALREHAAYDMAA